MLQNAQLVNLVKLTSVLALVVGAFVGCFGRQTVRAAAFPLCILLFMLPLPSQVIDLVILCLQSQSAALSYHLFSCVGIPVLREGVMLTVPGVTIEVAKECSGIDSSVAFLLTALLLAHRTLKIDFAQDCLSYLHFQSQSLRMQCGS